MYNLLTIHYYEDMAGTCFIDGSNNSFQDEVTMRDYYTEIFGEENVDFIKEEE